jgi:hypothetical protein
MTRPHRSLIALILVLLTAVPLFLSGCATPSSQAIAELPTLATTAVVPIFLTPTGQPTIPLTNTPISQPTNTPTSRPANTPISRPTNTHAPPPSPTPIPPAAQINGLAKEEFLLLPTAVQQNIRAIYAAGQERGRNPRAFSKLGDSNAATADFLMRFDQRQFDFSDYAHLQETINHYKGSFVRFGAALRIGLHATAVFRLEFVSEARCLPDEHMIACEFRLHNPSLFLIALGSNDQSDQFAARMERIIRYSLENGVIPVLITKADRHEGPDNRNNTDLRRLATQFNVPLLDFDRLAGTMPNRGLQSDGVHLTHYTPYSYALPEAFTYGYPILNLATLMMLAEIQAILQVEETAVSPLELLELP